MKQTSGTLLHRCRNGVLEVLLIHDFGSPYCGIPKGGVRPGETLEDAARRETWEETGIEAPAELTYLGSVPFGGDELHCFAGEVTDDAEPEPDGWEIDATGFVPTATAQSLLPPPQREFLARLAAEKEIEL